MRFNQWHRIFPNFLFQVILFKESLFIKGKMKKQNKTKLSECSLEFQAVLQGKKYTKACDSFEGC